MYIKGLRETYWVEQCFNCMTGIRLLCSYDGKLYRYCIDCRMHFPSVIQ